MKERMPKMKRFEESDCDENLVKTMVWDPIGRDSELIFFIRFLSSMMNDDKIVAINSKWGSGKTFFLKQFQLLCNYYADRLNNKVEINNYIYRYVGEKNQSISRFSFWGLLQKECEDFVSEECCEVLYFNAWEYDGNEDPIKSLMFFLIEKYNIQYEKMKVDWKEVGKKAITFLTGIEYGDDCIKSSNYFDEIVGNNDIKKIWVNILDEVINENCNKLYIIIDDLDRCRPEYAVKMFERLTHYANDKRVVFILAIDYEEMLCVIKHFYGYKGNVNRFLEKVIDQILDLDNRQYENYEKYLGPIVESLSVKKEYPSISHIVNKVVGFVFSDFSMTLREMARYSEIIDYISQFYDNYIEEHGGGLGNTILKGIVMPYVLGLNVSHRKEYYEFIRGDGKGKFVSFIERHKEVLAEIGLRKTNIGQIFEEIYNFIVSVMNRDKNVIETKDIENVRLYEDTVSYMFKCINRLYDFEIDECEE